MSSEQPYVVSVPTYLMRRVHAVLQDEGRPFESFNEFALAAFENQLTLLSGSTPVLDDSVDAGQDQARPTSDQLIESLLISLKSVAYSKPTAPPTDHGLELFLLTNRLTPLPFVMRVLLAQTANLERSPSLGEFCDLAQKQARIMAIHLRSSDESRGATGFNRRATGWPAGPDESKSLDRFAFSFLLSEGEAGGRGPLVEMRLATVTSESAVLPTELGVKLALAPNPILEAVPGAEDSSLGLAQQELLRSALLDMPAERDAIASFIHLVKKHNGMLSRVTDELLTIHKGWTAGRAGAHRAAMVGRLVDVDVLSVAGRGAKATATPTAHATPFVEDSLMAHDTNSIAG